MKFSFKHQMGSNEVDKLAGVIDRRHGNCQQDQPRIRSFSVVIDSAYFVDLSLEADGSAYQRSVGRQRCCLGIGWRDVGSGLHLACFGVFVCKLL